MKAVQLHTATFAFRFLATFFHEGYLPLDSSGDVTDLTQPTSFEVRLSEWTADGASHTTIQGRVPEISMHIGQAQLHRLACLSKDLARPQTSAEEPTQTPPVASGTGPVVKLDAALSVERLRVQLTNEHNTLVRLVPGSLGGAATGGGGWGLGGNGVGVVRAVDDATERRGRRAEPIVAWDVGC